MIWDIYEDLVKNLIIDGVLFYDDGVFDDYEDVSFVVFKVYEVMGLFGDINKICQLFELMQKWLCVKIVVLILFLKELIVVVQGYQNGCDMLIVCNIFLGLVFDLKVEIWMVQNYDDFLEVYDYVVFEVMLYMEEVKDLKDWMKKLIVVVVKYKDGLKKIIFELQVVDWCNQDKLIFMIELCDQMCVLCLVGAFNYGYYLDDFIVGWFDIEMLCDVMLFKMYIEMCKLFGGNKVSVEKFESSVVLQSLLFNGNVVGVDKKFVIIEVVVLFYVNKVGG